MTTLEIRIDGTVKRIEKLDAKIVRLQGLIEKKRAKIASGKEEANKYPSGKYFLESDIEWHEDDIERAKKERASEEKKLAEYRAKRKAELDEENSIPNVPVVEEFLANWRAKADTYYRAEVKALIDWKAEYRIYYKEKRKELEAEFGHRVNNYKDKEVDAREKELKIDYRYEPKYISEHWTGTVVMLSEHKGAEFEKRINKMLDDEVKARRADLYRRCSAVCGVIQDASGLKSGSNGSINGIVKGERANAEVETIFAGGYNIQCLHYRVLVKKVK